DPYFGVKFFDFIEHLPPGRQADWDDFNLLKVGRHLRFSDRAKLIVGREEAENNYLERFSPGRWIFRPVEVVGPTAIFDGEDTVANLEFAARVVARYSDGWNQQEVAIVAEKDDRSITFVAVPLGKEETAKFILT
ncbi:MAG: hypothetical protein ABH878_09610, partial [bacterium]